MRSNTSRGVLGSPKYLCARRPAGLQSLGAEPPTLRCCHPTCRRRARAPVDALVERLHPPRAIARRIPTRMAKQSMSSGTGALPEARLDGPRGEDARGVLVAHEAFLLAERHERFVLEEACCRVDALEVATMFIDAPVGACGRRASRAASPQPHDCGVPVGEQHAVPCIGRSSSRVAGACRCAAAVVNDRNSRFRATNQARFVALSHSPGMCPQPLCTLNEAGG